MNPSDLASIIGMSKAEVRRRAQDWDWAVDAILTLQGRVAKREEALMIAREALEFSAKQGTVSGRKSANALKEIDALLS